MSKENFPCNQCGECCRHINLVVELKDFDRGDGTCKYLLGNLCSIYHHRSDICNVEKQFEQKYRAKYTREEFYQLNLTVCRELQKLKMLYIKRNSRKSAVSLYIKHFKDGNSQLIAIKLKMV